MPITKVTDDPEPELYNYNGQVVTRSAMELLEKEDQLAAKGGLFERDGVIMTASALSLLQAQEAMDRSDSAGQGEYGRKMTSQFALKWSILMLVLRRSGYVGCHSVSGLSDQSAESTVTNFSLSRSGQYIPKWAKKLDPADQWPLVQEDGRMPIFVSCLVTLF